ncbi:hypothetical protein MXD63_43895, partial [Frankia sp. Cpl3]|nr:hypothetical protein [Frankia sp. Cpl3]
MLQAKLTSPVSPIRTYPLQELYSKQQAWASEIATTQSAVYETAKERKPDSSGTASSHWYSKTEEMQQNMHIFG